MNYRHAFHAGNFADVIKHIVLVRMLTYLQDKQAPFRVIDTHAGAGLYDLTSSEAQRGGEWLTGIARLMQARLSDKALPLIAPYLDIVRAFNPRGELKAYPGSPLIARALLRPQDRLTACEIEPAARKQLIDALRRDAQATLRTLPLVTSYLDDLARRPGGDRLRNAFASVWEVSHMDLRLALVAEGKGVTYVSDLVTHLPPSLVPIEGLPFSSIERQVGVYYLRHQPLSQAGSRFLALCRERWNV